MTNYVKLLIGSTDIILLSNRKYSRFCSYAAEKCGERPLQNTSMNGKNIRARMQEIGTFTWDIPTVIQEEINNSYQQSPEVKESDKTLDPNLSMWSTVNHKDHKETEERTKDHTLNIRSYYRDRWIQEHKEKRSDNITKQAVKILSFESSLPKSYEQTPHEASIYRKLTCKQYSSKKNESIIDREKDINMTVRESINLSHHINVDQFVNKNYKNITQRDRFVSSLHSPNVPEVSAPDQNHPQPTAISQTAQCSPELVTSKEYTFGQLENESFKKVSDPTNVGPAVCQPETNGGWSLNLQESCGKVWNTTKEEVKKENTIIEIQEPILNMKPDI